MSNSFKSLLLFSALLLSVAGAWAEGPSAESSTLKIKGEQRDEGIYKLALEYHPASNAPQYVGIVVWSEPSHTPILIHWNAEVGDEAIKNFMAGEAPLAETEGPLGASHPRITMRFEARGDEALLVEMIRPNGERRLVLAAKVDLADFEVSTEFVDGRDGAASLLGSKHCCSGGGCEKMCKVCDGPAFECDLVNCTIECSTL